MNHLQAKKFPEDGSHPVIALKGGKIGDWNGRSLSCMGASTLMINPDNADAHRLRGWYDATGQTTDFTPYSSDGSGSSSGSSKLNPFTPYPSGARKNIWNQCRGQ